MFKSVLNESRLPYLFVCIFLLQAVIFIDYTVDDAFITFRYSRNLISGLGPVFTAGERVEGITNFMWMLLMAGPIKAGVDPVQASKVLGLASSALLILALWKILEKEGVGLAARTLSTMLLALDGSLVLWSVGGLETSFFTLLCFVGSALAIANRPGQRLYVISGLLLGVGFLTRPEAAIFIALVFVFLLLEPNKTEAEKKGLRRWALTVFIIAVTFLTWRLIYYGDIFPNTFYAKTGRGLTQTLGGARYIYRYFMLYGGMLTIPLALLPLALGKAKRLYSFSLIIVFSFFGYVLLVSGADWMMLFRFLLPALPFLYLTVGFGVQEFSETFIANIRRPAAAAYFFSFCGLLLSVMFLTSTVTARFLHDTALHGITVYTGGIHRDAGLWLKRNAPATSLIAVADAGAIPYFSEMPTLDMSGLADPYLARIAPTEPRGLRLDLDYVFKREPDFIQLYSTTDITRQGFTNYYRGYGELFERALHEGQYVPVAPYNSGPGLIILRRQDRN